MLEVWLCTCFRGNFFFAMNKKVRVDSMLNIIKRNLIALVKIKEKFIHCECSVEMLVLNTNEKEEKTVNLCANPFIRISFGKCEKMCVCWYLYDCDWKNYDFAIEFFIFLCVDLFSFFYI